MANYIGVVNKNKHGEYCVSFPDFPGCITAGSDLEDAKQMANEALDFHIKGMLEDGDKIPVPSSLQSISADTDYRNSLAFIQVEAANAKPKTVRVNITVPENTLKQIDIAARKNRMSRSSFLINTARNAILNS